MIWAVPLVAVIALGYAAVLVARRIRARRVSSAR
jgi:hypothetical protein